MLVIFFFFTNLTEICDKLMLFIIGLICVNEKKKKKLFCCQFISAFKNENDDIKNRIRSKTAEEFQGHFK